MCCPEEVVGFQGRRCKPYGAERRKDVDRSGERGAGPEGVGTAGRPTEEFAEMAPSRNVPAMPYRDMPEPLSLGKMLGPSVILAGLGVGSGEYILWPFIASNIGLVDRKSTRLNSSHANISYAVFCLKKKKKKQI